MPANQPTKLASHPKKLAGHPKNYTKCVYFWYEKDAFLDDKITFWNEKMCFGTKIFFCVENDALWNVTKTARNEKQQNVFD